MTLPKNVTMLLLTLLISKYVAIVNIIGNASLLTIISSFVQCNTLLKMFEEFTNYLRQFVDNVKILPIL